MFAGAVARDAARREDGINPRAVKSICSGARRCRSDVRDSQRMTQPSRHVLREVIFAQRQLPTSVPRPRHETDSRRQRGSVDDAKAKAPTPFTRARVQQPAQPADGREKDSAPHVLLQKWPGITPASRQAPSKNCGECSAQRGEAKHKSHGETQIRKAAAPPRQFQNRHQQDQRDRKMDRQRMKAPDELRPLRTLVSVRREKHDENKKYKKERQCEKNKTKLPEDAASLRCHEGQGPRKLPGQKFAE